MIRRLRFLSDKDYHDYVSLINQLSKLGEISQEAYEDFAYKQDSHSYVTFVYEQDGKLVSCLTLLLESKLAGNVLHIEDVVTDSAYQVKGIASKLIDYAKEFAIKNKCYKIILDCSDVNEQFYNKLGFYTAGNYMRFDIGIL